jgi:DNA processing protein
MTLRRPRDLARDAGPTRRLRPDRLAHLVWPHGFADSTDDRAALLVLLGLASLTARRLLELSAVHPTARACLAAVRSGAAGSDADRARAADVLVGGETERLEAAGARLVAVGDPEYPPALLDLFDPPAALFVRGHPLSGLTPRVSIGGARNGSASGRDTATALGQALAGAGVCVVSGGARGIDAAAHRGALAGGGRSICVLGCGIDLAYPRQHRGLFEELALSGAVVSEYPPGTKAEPFRFPARNRIVAGLSQGVVVVEGAAGSGSMITADHALDLGREVFAVPGPVWSALAQVPLELIRDGATLIRGPDDLLQDLGVAPAAAPGGARGRVMPALSDPARLAWGALDAPATADHVAVATGIALPGAMAALLELELRGLVRQVGGRYERRVQMDNG